MARAEKAVTAHLVKSPGQYMLEEPVQKLLRSKRPGFPPLVPGIPIWTNEFAMFDLLGVVIPSP
jgi:hypothetical protein